MSLSIAQAQEGMFSMTIEIGHFFKVKGEYLPPDREWIILRETTVMESRAYTRIKGDDKQTEWLEKKLEDLIVEHSFRNSEGVAESNKDVANLITSRGSLYAHVLKEWVSQNPFRTEIEETADKSPSTTSTGGDASQS